MEYFQDLINVSADEAKHFLLLQERISKVNIKYGDLPVHTGLLQNVLDSMNCVLTRLSLISIIQEGKGVDADPKQFQMPLMQLAKLVLLEDLAH
ncbi:hypothetical protein IMG5_202720 [Ichthyophthirius multifiliis]|uniref:Uncharacterized protein n=1 Tax=Ichthyophthirius multifiliis TaxID=5932 RepID=G0R670_ICHMU|nr:hypothetical protein IMG5_202720 [Ichthyophthirius multifiliis]EGR27034.1 hypothetical protein IMG5_202720 [Ichthyophthirius multifiliis]|eukprot:XP_004023918.1 hypothetical protein IMG5_202720 [Ichthyophthirius multifiliis]